MGDVILEANQMIVQSPSYGVPKNTRIDEITSKGKLECELSAVDYADYLNLLYEMYSKELVVKCSIIQELSFKMESSVLRTYLLIWKVQPHLNVNQIKELEGRLELQQYVRFNKSVNKNDT
eukprot:TRINITY_DN2005_c0_g1_i1.p1 TRINITY_DN2005_c0_g1~~TRINITY_DN2005_c0_g1_i1.p1  ORF type:complete len:121 (+),score=17.28 TRINITY_DN2005_c0_g1_i1:384-746(+)